MHNILFIEDISTYIIDNNKLTFFFLWTKILHA